MDARRDGGRDIGTILLASRKRKDLADLSLHIVSVVYMAASLDKRWFEPLRSVTTSKLHPTLVCMAWRLSASVDRVARDLCGQRYICL